MLNVKLKLLMLAVILSLGACTWVKLTPEGEKVRVLSMSEVSTCKKLGKTTTTLKDKIAGMSRKQAKVEKEMQALARNSAAGMGGDTVVPVTEVADGRQTFEVYKCINP
jgi:prefoldin subunit 5